MEWLLVVIAVVLLVHVLIVWYVWRGARGRPGQRMALGTVMRFVILPLAIVVGLLVATFFAPELRSSVLWMLVAALVAFLAYLSVSVIVFARRVMQEYREQE